MTRNFQLSYPEQTQFSKTINKKEKKKKKKKKQNSDEKFSTISSEHTHLHQWKKKKKNKKQNSDEKY